ncbi:hypothetical protein F8388_016580 [Cannabis sativa]|uniref:Uncharacterized protein n=1 Tax=Cannabis sativa TaxID=3483 RepID=A0A7J6EYF0_CANSA|nr:hypothetical protein F8388_016580 [Cannabis sativa]
MPASELLLSDSTSTNRMSKFSIPPNPVHHSSMVIRLSRGRKPLGMKCPCAKADAIALTDDLPIVDVCGNDIIGSKRSHFLNIQKSLFGIKQNLEVEPVYAKPDISVPMSVPGWLLARQLDLDGLGLSHINL